MSTSRREFLKAGGFTLLGVSGAAPFITARERGDTPREAPPELQGKRFAMAIDTRKCEHCQNRRACAEACHREHNVPDWEDREEEVKWIWNEPLERVFHGRVNEYTDEALRERAIPVLCNHCDKPPCVKVCPTKATFKREDGPVMMDQHRCIGCRYCVVGCPYGARSFNWSDPRDYFKAESSRALNPGYPTRRKGVVEKCTMCTERLAMNLEPACVEACAQSGAGALLFGDLEERDSPLRRAVESSLAVRRKAELGTRPRVFYEL